MEARYNEGPRDWQNYLLALTRFGYIQVLFDIFYYFWGEENGLLYLELCYIEACYIEVPLYKKVGSNKNALKHKCMNVKNSG